jgi:hypothetical protein
MKTYLLAAVAALAISGAANATELLVNGSFEAPNIGTGSYTYPDNFQAGSVNYGGWDWDSSALVNASGGNAWYIGSGPSGKDGVQFAALQGTSTLSQTFTASNASAKLSWLDAGRSFFGSYNGDQTYDVLLNGTVVGTYSTASNSSFAGHSLSLTGLTAGQSYTLTFAGRVNADETSFLDAVSVNGVPEPAQWALLISGFGLVGAASRRRRTNTVFA